MPKRSAIAREAGLQRRQIDREIGGGEHHPHEEMAGLDVVELLGVENVLPVMGQERRNRRNDAGTIRTGQGQHELMIGHGGLGLRFETDGTAICGPALSPADALAPIPADGVMMNKQQAIGVRAKIMADRLNGYRILILETREEAQFSRLLAEQGADVLQCPMFTIHDAPDPAPIEAWIRRFIDTAVRRSGADDRRRPAPADEGGAADRTSSRISSPRSARRANSPAAQSPAGRCARSGWSRR